MKHPLASLLLAGAIGIVATHSAEAQLRFQLNFGGGDDWCGPFRHHYDHHSHAPVFSPWSPAGYLPYHDPYRGLASRLVVPSIRYTVVPTDRTVVPSTPRVSPTAKVASSRPIYTSRRATNTAELVSAFLAQAKEEFRVGNYDDALKNLDEANSITPNSPSIRQLRALALYALGRYDEAADLVMSIQEAGIAWDWDTMIGNYPSEDVYERQMRRLEHRVNSDPNNPGPRYLLGYHYHIGGHVAAAETMFEQASQPTVVAAREPAPKPALVPEAPPKPKPAPKIVVEDATMAAVVAPSTIEPVEPEPAMSIAGTWRSVSADGKTITLEIDEDGTFAWEYDGASAESILSGDWKLGDDGKLDLVDKDVPLSGTVEMEGDNTMRFVLDGTPEGDPGLVFERN